MRSSLHISLLDTYHARQSAIHDLDPRVKIVICLMIILVAVLLPEGAWISQGLLFGLILLFSVIARLGPYFTVRRSLIALPFILAALPIPFLTPGPTLWMLPWPGWVVTTTGFVRFLNILVRTWIAVQASVLLSATTDISDLLWGLSALKVPPLIVSIIGFMIRYLFILADEANRMIRARLARSPKLRDARRPGFIWQGQVAGMMVGSLFLRALERSERVHAAMLSRGYDGMTRALYQPLMRKMDWLALLVILLVLIPVFVLGIGG